MYRALVTTVSAQTRRLSTTTTTTKTTMSAPKRLPQHVVIGADHGGFALKEELRAFIASKFASIKVEDVGCYSEERVDYPTFGKLVGSKVTKTTTELMPETLGIVVCGSGIGISIAANKVQGVRCALAHDHYTGKMCRLHNNANVLALGGRTTGPEVAKEIVEAFLTTEFEGGRHGERIAMMEC
ncbi:Ribose/Galactose isomerase-domain-containing protein [Catenaria anguillulae PL171]|uniref:Ribose/Galactose isomerase-domain-containing protein n=1 Tax=Catenaria anguillulae PL171 TaxID=765915 RepID=A0A1Y2HQ66_9FUNG|nr:Ribose/Galactose isomerase-domain-containing protein [Catenaria anguillulae PL171]